MGEAVGMLEVFGLATAALEAAKARAEELAGVVTDYKIARPTEDTEKMLKLTGLDKGEPHIINEKDIEEI